MNAIEHSYQFPMKWLEWKHVFHFKGRLLFTVNIYMIKIKKSAFMCEIEKFSNTLSCETTWFPNTFIINLRFYYSTFATDYLNV